MGMEVSGYFWDENIIDEINSETAEIIEHAITNNLELDREAIRKTAAKCRQTGLYNSRTIRTAEAESGLRESCKNARDAFQQMVIKIARAPGYIYRMASVVLLIPLIDEMLEEEGREEDSQEEGIGDAK